MAASPRVIDIAPAFDGAAVVVTGVGGAGQAGESVAAAFAARGATVHCIDRDRAAVNDRVSELRAMGWSAVAHAADLTDADGTAAVAANVAAAHDGRIAAVAGIAGGFGASGPIAESDPGVLDRQLAINARTAYVTARAFLPAVRAVPGAFVFVTAAAALRGGKVGGISGYAMAKGAVIQLVRALAQEERPNGVRVNAVAPTSLRTSANLDAMGADMRYVEREEFAAAIVALCGPAFARVTGQVIELA